MVTAFTLAFGALLALNAFLNMRIGLSSESRAPAALCAVMGGAQAAVAILAFFSLASPATAPGVWG